MAMAGTQFIDARTLKSLQQLQSWRTGASLAGNWLVIAAAITGSMLVGELYAWLIAAIIIGGRMHALGVLVHEFAHYRFVHDKRVNDWVGDVFAAWPLLVTVDGYRNNHLQHHQHANTEKDPDYMVKVGIERWTFPKRVRNLILTLGGYVAGINGYRDMRTALDRLNKAKAMPKAYIASRLSFYVGVLALMALIGGLDEFLIYWLIPYGCLFFTFNYVRSTAEHFAIDKIEQKLEGTRTVIPHVWEKAFFSPHNVSYHLEHHLYPAVPYYNLPKLHAELMKNADYRARAHITHGYTTGLVSEVLRHGQRTLLKPKPDAAGLVPAE
jgi:fatty acid desaturase